MLNLTLSYHQQMGAKSCFECDTKIRLIFSYYNCLVYAYNFQKMQQACFIHCEIYTALLLFFCFFNQISCYQDLRRDIYFSYAQQLQEL